MSSLILMVMLQVATTQFLVSTKAGLVNFVQGATTVKAATSVPAGKVVATGPGGAVEILLNPGSYLRMGENSRLILEKVELYDIAVRILEGSAVITANGFDKDLPLQVATRDLKMEIIKDGIYLFADGKVVVVDGKIRDASNNLTYGKGFEISNDQGYRARKVKTFTTALEIWSQKRDAEISRANLNVARSLQQTQNLPISSLLDVWLWYPAYGAFIYMPGARYRSPYGYRYQAAGRVQTYGNAGNSSGRGGGGGGFSTNTTNSAGSTSSASSGGGGGGGGYSGGGGGVGPAVSTSAQPPSSSQGSHTPSGGRPTAQ
jgi:hypothetical protein